LSDAHDELLCTSTVYEEKELHPLSELTALQLNVGVLVFVLVAGLIVVGALGQILSILYTLLVLMFSILPNLSADL